MRNWSPELRETLERPLDGGVIAMLAIIEAKRGEVFTITNQPANVKYQGMLFQSFPFRLETIEDNGKGDLPTNTLTLSNVGMLPMQYLEVGTFRGGLCRITFMVAGRADLDILRSIDYRMQGASATQAKVSIILGQSNLRDKAFPGERYLRNKWPALQRNQH